MATFRSIVVAIDFSDTSQEAFRVACRLAGDEDATLHLLHIVPDVRQRLGAVERPGQTFHDLQQEWNDQAGLRLAALARDDSGTVVRHAVVGTQPAEAIAHYAAEHDADLLVVGTHGYGPVRRWLLGSVSDRVIRIADRPVLTVPPKRAAGSTVAALATAHA